MLKAKKLPLRLHRTALQLRFAPRHLLFVPDPSQIGRDYQHSISGAIFARLLWAGSSEVCQADFDRPLSVDISATTFKTLALFSASCAAVKPRSHYQLPALPVAATEVVDCDFFLKTFSQ